MRVRSEIGKVRGDVGWKSTYCVVVTPTCIDGIVQYNASFVYKDQNSRYNGDNATTRKLQGGHGHEDEVDEVEAAEAATQHLHRRHRRRISRFVPRAS